MAEKSSNQPNITLPQRTITITGEYSARMVQNTVRVSRIEQRAIQIAMAPPAIRDAGRRAMDRFAQATSQFESELAQIEKELEASGRNSNRRRTNGQERRDDQRQPLTRNNSAANNSQAQKQTQPKPVATSQGGTSAKAEPAKPARARDQGKASEGASQAQSQGKQETKTAEPAKQPAKAPAAGSEPAPKAQTTTTNEVAPADDAAPVAVAAAPASLEAL